MPKKLGVNLLCFTLWHVANRQIKTAVIENYIDALAFAINNLTGY